MRTLLNKIVKFEVRGVDKDTPCFNGSLTDNGGWFFTLTQWPGFPGPGTGNYCNIDRVYDEARSIFERYHTPIKCTVVFSDDSTAEYDSLSWAIPNESGVDLSEVNEVGITDGTVYSNCNEYTVYHHLKPGDLWERRVYCDGQEPETIPVEIVTTGDVDSVIAWWRDTVSHNRVQVGELDCWIDDAYIQ